MANLSRARGQQAVVQLVHSKTAGVLLLEHGYRKTSAALLSFASIKPSKRSHVCYKSQLTSFCRKLHSRLVCKWDVRFGSKAEKLTLSKCFPLCRDKQTFACDLSRSAWCLNGASGLRRPPTGTMRWP